MTRTAKKILEKLCNSENDVEYLCAKDFNIPHEILAFTLDFLIKNSPKYIASPVFQPRPFDIELFVTPFADIIVNEDTKVPVMITCAGEDYLSGRSHLK